MRIQQFFSSRKELVTTTQDRSVVASTRRVAYESRHSRNKIILLFFIIISPTFLLANFIGMNHGARAMAMGNAYIALADEPTAIFFNPAGLTKINQFYLKASHQNLYGISDLYNDMVAFSAPLPYYRLGLAFTQLSLTDEYSEQVFYLSTASIIRPFRIPVRFGTTIKYEKISVLNYEGADNPSNYDLNAGIMIDARKDLTFAFVANNILRPDFKIVTESEKLNTEFKTGICYNWRKSVNFAADYVWSDEDSYWNLGGEMWFYDVFAARIGMNEDKFTTGFGIKAKYWTIDGALLSHTSLGSTYRISVGVKFGRTQKEGKYIIEQREKEWFENYPWIRDDRWGSIKRWIYKNCPLWFR